MRIAAYHARANRSSLDRDEIAT